jgi:hypothetical protein
MTHIIDRSLSEDVSDDTPPGKMGIQMLFTGSTRSVRALYLEDFGALFMVKVNFPLQGAPSQKEPAPEKAPDSEWERARREVLGVDESNAWPDVFGGENIDFDPKRVDALKTVLIRALKNAANIRHLKSDEVVSISVFGSGPRLQLQAQPTAAPSADAPRTKTSSRPQIAAAGSGYGAYGLSSPGGGAMVVTQLTASSGKGTVLTLRVKKSDIDAFAKGDQDEAAFTKTVAFNTYTGAGHDITSVNSWVNEIRR